MEDKVLYNVLKTINRNRSAGNSAPDEEYVSSLINIGLVKSEWDNTYLTELGKSILGVLSNKFEKW